MKKSKHIGIHIIMIITAIVFIYPFLVVLSSSFQSEADLFKNGYSLFPKELTLSTYKAILRNPTSLIRAYGITILTSAITVFLGVLASMTCAYVLSRRNYKYRTILTALVFIPMFIGGGMVANYINITQILGMKNTLWVLIFPGLVSPWYILLMKGFLSSIPYSLIEAAKIDGASEFSVFSKIIIPLSKPAIATIALFYLLGSWNEWYNSMLYIDNDKLVKLQFLLMRIQSSIDFMNSAEALQYGAVQVGQEIPVAGTRMAMCILVAGPMLVVFPFFQKYFVEGLTVGAVKG